MLTLKQILFIFSSVGCSRSSLFSTMVLGGMNLSDYLSCLCLSYPDPPSITSAGLLLNCLFEVSFYDTTVAKTAQTKPITEDERSRFISHPF